MTTQRGMLRGPKFSARHQTFVEAAKPFLIFSRDCDVIKKVVIGKIKPTSGKTYGTKLTKTDTSVKVEITTPRQWQEFYAIGDPEVVLSTLTTFFE